MSMVLVVATVFLVGKYHSTSTWLVGIEVDSCQTGVQRSGRYK